MSTRAGIVVTGTEVLAGRVRDRNGPWLSDRLAELGIELAHVGICGDRREDLEAQLRFLAGEGVDVIITSGGLGPTADDLTAEVVARFQDREMYLDAALEHRIAAIVEPLLKRWRNLDPEAIRISTRKQATIPEGAEVLGPAGTAPGLVVAPPPGRVGPAVVVLPGPPGELHRLWPEALATAAFREATADRSSFEHEMLRMVGIPESEIAETLRIGEERIDGMDELEITTCLRRGELEVAIRYEPPAREAWERAPGAGARAPRTEPLLRRRHQRGRAGGCSSERLGPHGGRRRVLHRGRAGGPPERSSRGVRLLRRWSDRLRRRGQGPVAGRRRGAARASWCGLAAGGRGDGRGRARAPRRRRGRRRSRGWPGPQAGRRRSLWATSASRPASPTGRSSRATS